MERLLQIIRRMRDLLDEDPGRRTLQVSYDLHHIWLRRRDEDGYDMSVRFAWSSIRRVCFKDCGPMASDMLYVFTGARGKALTIPLEAQGGGAFWRELRTRSLFPPALHEEATLSTNGRLYCWPALAEPESDGIDRSRKNR
jgi:hypothetical protein